MISWSDACSLNNREMLPCSIWFSSGSRSFIDPWASAPIFYLRSLTIHEVLFALESTFIRNAPMPRRSVSTASFTFILICTWRTTIKRWRASIRMPSKWVGNFILSNEWEINGRFRPDQSLHDWFRGFVRFENEASWGGASNEGKVEVVTAISIFTTDGSPLDLPKHSDYLRQQRLDQLLCCIRIWNSFFDFSTVRQCRSSASIPWSRSLERFEQTDLITRRVLPSAVLICRPSWCCFSRGDENHSSKTLSCLSIADESRGWRQHIWWSLVLTPSMISGVRRWFPLADETDVKLIERYTIK